MVSVLVGGIPGGGTKYVARVIDACGRSAGHETMLKDNPNIMRPTNHEVEVSWLCVEWFPIFKGKKILIARAPYNVIRSLYGFGFLITKQWPLFLKNEEFMYFSGIERLARFYISWMLRELNYADEVWNVHNLDYNKLSTVAPLPYKATAVPKDTNSKIAHWSEVDMPWPPACEPELVDTAEQLGVPTRVGN